MTTPTSLRDEAFTRLDAADAHDENTLLREQIVALGERMDVFSSNDLPQWVRDRTNPNRRGRAFKAAIDARVIEVVGFVKSANPATHGHRVLTYRLVTA